MKHNANTKAVAPVIYAVGSEYRRDLPGQAALTYGTVRRDVVGDHITYVVRNRMGVELIVDADSIDCLIAALHKVRAEGQL